MLHEGRGREGVTNEVRGMSDRDEVKTGRWGGLGRKMPGGHRVYYLSVGEWIGKHTQAHGHTHTQHTDAEQQNASAPCNNLLIHQLHYNRSIMVQTCLLLPAREPTYSKHDGEVQILRSGLIYHCFYFSSRIDRHIAVWEIWMKTKSFLDGGLIVSWQRPILSQH